MRYAVSAFLSGALLWMGCAGTGAPQSEPATVERLETSTENVPAEDVNALPDSIAQVDVKEMYTGLRGAPSITSRRLRNVPEEAYPVSEYRDGYYKIRVASDTGWVNDDAVDANRAAIQIKKDFERERAARQAEREHERARHQARQDSIEAARIAAERRAKRRRLEALRRKGYSIMLHGMDLDVNSADGATPRISFSNISTDKTVKYIWFTFRPFNPVGDPVTGRLRGMSTRKMKGVGPIPPGERASFEFDNAWYSATASCVEVHRIRVEHMDGSSFTYVNDLKDIASDESDNLFFSPVSLRGDCQ